MHEPQPVPSPPAAATMERGGTGCARRTGDSANSDRGASPIELAILLPLIFALLFMSIQAGVYFLARAVALNAAQIGVNSTRTLSGDSEAEAEAKVWAYIDAAPEWLSPTSVDVERNDATGEATATVEGSVLSLLPGLNISVRQTARGPIERFTSGD